MQTLSRTDLLPEPKLARWIVLGFICARLAALLAMPLEGLRGYGDFVHFFTLASLPGWPFLTYWSEFPPIFSFLSALLYRMAGGQEHVYDYLLFFVMTLADAGSLYLFTRLSRRMDAGPVSWARVGGYLLMLLSLAYCWWYFDSLAVFFMLAGLSLLVEGKWTRGGGVIAVGLLTKWFPGLALILCWRRCSLRQLVRVAVISLLPVLLIWGALWAVSPRFTRASLVSQGSKGSWETVWALLDGNYQTGNFGPESERADPAAANQSMGHPAVISPWLRLILFAGIGLALIFKIRPQNDRQSFALVGLAWCLFLLWSPGWSPQWVLYLLPLILLVLPDRQAFLFAIMFILVNLLEWPILLSRGMFSALPLTVVLRTLLLALLVLVFHQEASRKMV